MQPVTGPQWVCTTAQAGSLGGGGPRLLSPPPAPHPRPLRPGPTSPCSGTQPAPPISTSPGHRAVTSTPAEASASVLAPLFPPVHTALHTEQQATTSAQTQRSGQAACRALSSCTCRLLRSSRGLCTHGGGSGPDCRLSAVPCLACPQGWTVALGGCLAPPRAHALGHTTQARPSLGHLTHYSIPILGASH